MAYLRHPNIDWAAPTVRPRSPADPATGAFAAAVFVIIHNSNINPLPVQPASALIPDPAVGYVTAS